MVVVVVNIEKIMCDLVIFFVIDQRNGVFGKVIQNFFEVIDCVWLSRMIN